jgi:hypothetical protein
MLNCAGYRKFSYILPVLDAPHPGKQTKQTVVEKLIKFID